MDNKIDLKPIIFDSFNEFGIKKGDIVFIREYLSAIKNDCVIDAILVGKGAGGVPRASAILSDIIGLKKSNPNTVFKKVCISDYNAKSHYLCIKIPDNPGNLEKLTHAITQSGISIKTLIQNSTRSDKNTVDVLVITYPSEQGYSHTDLVQHLPDGFRVVSALGFMG